uniref:Profilin family member 4 n=1 Tax=Strix occidentalis caurina TaxID=311401 RepID=A0A8D0FNC0_STROC
MNQLQALLNDSLTRTKHVENAAIIDIMERQVCASTFGFNVRDQRATYYKLEGEDYLKEKYYKCIRGMNGGLIVVKTKAFILVATYRVGMYPSVCMEAVETLGKRNPNL